MLSSKLSVEDHHTLLRHISESLHNESLPSEAKSDLARLLVSEASLQDWQDHGSATGDWPAAGLASLVTYTVRVIGGAGQDLLKLQDPVLLSCQHDGLLSIIIALCATNISKALVKESPPQVNRLGSERPRYQVVIDEITERELVEGTALRQVFISCRDVLTPSAPQCIFFLRALALNSGSLSKSFFHIIELLQICIRSVPDELFRGSRDALVVLLAPAPDSILASDHEVAESMPLNLWRTICDLISSPLVERKTAGYVLWSRILTSPAISPPPTAVYDENYWLILWAALAQGSPEHRKYALTIIRGTLALLDTDVDVPSMTFRVEYADDTKAQYAKYAALFETIVLSRYLNQVQSSLPDLSVISQPGSLISKTWIVALLHAALGHGMQDSIRKVIGDWTLTHGYIILVASPKSTPAFLEEAFLPWAMLGYHYTGSVRKNKDGLRTCKHGESVCQFLVQTTEASPKPLTIVESILAYLSAQGGRMFPFGRAYALEAVAQASKSGNVTLGSNGQQRLIDVASRQGFQSMVQDLMTLRCAQIAQSTDGAQLE